MKLPIKSCLCIGIILLPGLVAAQSNDIAPELNLHLVEVDTAAHVEPIYTTGTVLALRTTELVPLVGGMVLALMTLPTIIISSRAAIKAVPPSIRDGALGVGASKVQATMHHVVPLAIPGMLTGTIIGMAQALGETAPLLMIGMVAFIVDIPGGVTDPGTVLPVQIFMWADFAERMFIQKTSSAIIILLSFLIIMNGGAIWLRKKLERRW